MRIEAREVRADAPGGSLAAAQPDDPIGLDRTGVGVDLAVRATRSGVGCQLRGRGKMLNNTYVHLRFGTCRQSLAGTRF